MNRFRRGFEAPRTRLPIPLVVPPGVPPFSSSYVAFARPSVIPATEDMPCTAIRGRNPGDAWEAQQHWAEGQKADRRPERHEMPAVLLVRWTPVPNDAFSVDPKLVTHADRSLPGRRPITPGE